ncbi:hypothetical protein THII_1139 [Thioploca ingrica]|uniref:Glycosyltransferase 2-like domain-containing protein n=1 Tax=Thioploca ingrica TaxID=40754 RepID=A0A090BUN9_9GAMM|nr:hypothetical protein THII_1139 [Thioploca ingrica]
MSTQQSPVISTVVLNWNRADLLFQTLKSYAETITVPYELFIIDNASTDNSKAVIKDFCSQNPYSQAIFLPQNRGGEALNLGLEKAAGKYLHLSENDVKYLPHWADKCIDIFENFAQLGQLSLFGPLSADDTWGGVGDFPPSQLRHSRGRIIYELDDNSGTTCVIRREIWDRGIRIHSHPEREGVIFPHDGQFSAEIKQAGYIVARSDHPFIKNVGHTIVELQSRPDYYLKNYRAKPWFGEAKLQAKIAKWEQSDKPPARLSFLFPEEPILREKSRPHDYCAEPYLWSMLDEWTPEIELIEFIYTLVRLLKPKFCLETGTWRGFLAETIGCALQQNGRGRLISLEKEADIYTMAHNRIIERKLTHQVKVIHANSLATTINEKIDLLILNSAVEIKLAEFWHFQPALNQQAMIVFLDTNAIKNELQNLAFSLKKLSFATPRGIVVCQWDEHQKLTQRQWAKSAALSIYTYLRRFLFS